MATTVVSEPVVPEPVLSSALEGIASLERNYLVQNYARYPLALQRGRGCYVYDVDGNLVEEDTGTTTGERISAP